MNFFTLKNVYVSTDAVISFLVHEISVYILFTANITLLSKNIFDSNFRVQMKYLFESISKLKKQILLFS